MSLRIKKQRRYERLAATSQFFATNPAPTKRVRDQDAISGAVLGFRAIRRSALASNWPSFPDVRDPGREPLCCPALFPVGMARTLAEAPHSRVCPTTPLRALYSPAFLKKPPSLLLIFPSVALVTRPTPTVGLHVQTALPYTLGTRRFKQDVPASRCVALRPDPPLVRGAGRSMRAVRRALEVGSHVVTNAM